MMTSAGNSTINFLIFVFYFLYKSFYMKYVNIVNIIISMCNLNYFDHAMRKFRGVTVL